MFEPDRLVAAGDAFCLSQGSVYRFRVTEELSVLVFRLYAGREVPVKYFPSPPAPREPEEPVLYILRMNRLLRNFVETARLAAAEEGTDPHEYMTVKIFELCMVLRAGYTEEEATSFFAPVMSRDYSFTDFVMENYLRADTVNELVEMSPYSPSAFKRRFRESFGGESPSVWMKRQKAARILHLLTNSSLNLKEISALSGFGSLPRFTAFCRENLGTTPGAIRREKEKNTGSGRSR